VFLSEQSALSKVTTTVRSEVFRSWHRPTIMFYRSSAQTSTVSGVCVSRYCCYRNRAAGSKPS